MTTYYLVAFAIFYRKEIKFWINKLQRVDTRNSFLFDRMQEADILTGNNALQSLQRDIIQTLNECLNRKLIEQEILLSLELLLANHKDQLMPSQRDKINEYVIRECKNICSIHLDEEKTVSLWLSKG